MEGVETKPEVKNHASTLNAFCDSGLKSYNTKLRKAFIDQDWMTLRELSLQFERESYDIGAVEICGKLISLRIQMDSTSRNLHNMSITLRNIEESSDKLIVFLKKYLQSKNQLSDNSFTSEPIELKKDSWYCNIQ